MISNRLEDLTSAGKSERKELIAEIVRARISPLREPQEHVEDHSPPSERFSADERLELLGKRKMTATAKPEAPPRPAGWRIQLKRSQIDDEARWNVMHGKIQYGYTQPCRTWTAGTSW